MKTKGLIAIIGLCAFMFAAETSGAQSGDQRGSLLCADFEEAERLHREDPDDAANRLLYARCLLTREETTARALYMLERLRENDNDVHAAYLMAEFAKSGGTFDVLVTNGLFIDRALEDYLRVLKLIDGDPSFPGGQEDLERRHQMELRVRYVLPLLYLVKYEFGFQGLHKYKLANSPSYTGGEINIPLVEDVARFYTRSHLEDVIRLAAECGDLPRKEHFRNAQYEGYTQACRLTAAVAERLLELDEERLNHVVQDYCEDITDGQCPEYHEVVEDIAGVLIQRERQEKEIFARAFQQASDE